MKSWLKRLRVGPMGWPLLAAGVKADDFWTTEDLEFGRSLPRSSYHYGRDIRRGFDSNVVMAPVAWIMRTFIEAMPVVESEVRDRWRRVKGHKLEQRLRRPNDFYDGLTLWAATIISYALDGNAYWLKMRNRVGEVLELWYAPHWLIEPKWPQDGSSYISHYEYRPDGKVIELAPRDVIHFRFGLDPRSTRMGFGSLRPLLREVFTDEEAANFSASILRNMGVPGLIISPKDAGSAITPTKAREMKELISQHFTRDRRGDPFVATGPTDVSQFGFDPNQLMLGNLRDITEERVCAMLGVPAAVVGFGAGLQQTKVGATMRELVRLARVNCINPMARIFGSALTEQLVPDYQSRSASFRVRFDMSEVSVFQEDETAWEERILKRVQGGVLTVAQAQDMLGLEVDDTQEVYLRDSRLQAVPANEDPTTEPEPSGNGSGDMNEEQMAELLQMRSRFLLAGD